MLHRTSTLLARHGVRHGFSLRTGGVSRAPFEALNLARNVGDDDAAVDENRRRLAIAVDYAEDRLYEVSQVHGADVRVLAPDDSVAGVRTTEADAIVALAREARVAIGVRVADCVPVLIADIETRAVAAVHAGWRGVVRGVIPAALDALAREAGSRPSSLVAALGPHIRVGAFEVGDDVAREIAAVAHGRAVVHEATPRPFVDSLDRDPRPARERRARAGGDRRRGRLHVLGARVVLFVSARRGALGTAPRRRGRVTRAPAARYAGRSMRDPFRTLALMACCLVPPASSASCAGSECRFHSQCERLHYCESGLCLQDCQRDFDCGAGMHCTEIGQCASGTADGGATDGAVSVDGGPIPTDGLLVLDGGPVGSDGGPMGTDGGPMGADGGPLGTDGGPAGTGRYLDRCTRDADCASGRCVDDVGGTRMCTRACASDGACADEHVCASSVCVHDDTGAPCSTTTPATCAKGLCVGPSGGTGACTKTCANASDCPAGYACTSVGGMFVCVDIEKPCAAAADCATGLCIPGLGCTSTCRNATDCPGRFSFLPPYTCAVAHGSSSAICNPPSDILGDDAAGAICPAVGTNECRSDACDTSAPITPMCTQACTAESGCGPGLGCFPEIDGTDLYLLCSRAGTGALGHACTTGRECDSGLCDATASVCTRLCMDALCPTGWSCEPVPGFGISICRP